MSGTNSQYSEKPGDSPVLRFRNVSPAFSVSEVGDSTDGNKSHRPSLSRATSFSFLQDASSASAYSFIDLVETLFDSRLDLLERRLRAMSAQIKARAAKTLTLLDDNASSLKTMREREFAKYRMIVATRVQNVMEQWHEATNVRLRDKFTFMLSKPEWVHISYTAQILVLLPLRAFSYTRLTYHYFLFDFCYFQNILVLLFLYVMPSSQNLLTAVYCLTMGPLAWAVPTWRNSMVFHSLDRMTSLIIHIYPPLRHFYPNASIAHRFPAVASLEMNPIQGIWLSMSAYLIWQFLYLWFISYKRRTKIARGLRTTSFTYLSSDKHHPVSKILQSIPTHTREGVFMLLQITYTFLTILPALFLYTSKIWSTVFVLFIFLVSAWNGASYYMDVYGMKFQKELNNLRKEMEQVNARNEDHRVDDFRSEDGKVDE